MMKRMKKVLFLALLAFFLCQLIGCSNRSVGGNTAQASISDTRSGNANIEVIQRYSGVAEAAKSSMPAKKSGGISRQIELLEREQQSYGFSRRVVENLPFALSAGGYVQAMGWSREDILLIVYRNPKGKVIVCAVDIERPKERVFSEELSALESERDIAFFNEDSRRPIIMAWAGNKVVSAFEVDIAGEQVNRLEGKELSALKEEITRLLGPEDLESPPIFRPPSKLEIVDGNGKILEREELPSWRRLQSEFPGYRNVAYRHEPRLYLFSTFPGIINVDAIDGDPTHLMAYFRTGGVPDICDDPVSYGDSYRYITKEDRIMEAGTYLQMVEACISADGSRVAYLLNREIGKRVVSPDKQTEYEYEKANSSELRLMCPEMPYALVDFSDKMWAGSSEEGRRGTVPHANQRRWSGGINPRQADFSYIAMPSLSPEGRRLAYVKARDIWVAELRAAGK